MVAVHPHACGEHIARTNRRRLKNGSSPRLWGTRHCPNPVNCCNRFIPTPVGNTWAVMRTFTMITVHPHACGEHILLISRICPQDGSSPRLWGTPARPVLWRGARRFIPTPVGNTGGHTEFPQHRTVHPHACGEHMTSASSVFGTPGSSPRLWGTPLRPRPGLTIARFIPTPVGNTLRQ